MPEELNKTEQINLRVSAVQLERLDEAVRIVSLEKGEAVDRATLARELIVQGVENIRSRAA
jgi:hypothetical protein